MTLVIRNQLVLSLFMCFYYEDNRVEGLQKRPKKHVRHVTRHIRQARIRVAAQLYLVTYLP